MRKKYLYIFSLIVISIVIFNIVSVATKKQAVSTSSGTIENLSSKKIEWGIKRNNKHEQPDLGATNKRIIDEAKGIAMGNKESKKVYLTFDEGYEAGYTEKILEVLKQNEVKACFFITAHYVNTSAELVQKMIDEGHIIGNHTVNHKSMPSLNLEQIKSEVMNLHTAVYEKFGYEMKYIRPPKGEFSQRTLKITNSIGYKNVMWSFAYEDWNEDNQPGEEKSKKKILDNLHNGEIMLLHGNSKTNTNILDSLIKEAKNMGYEFKSLDDFE